MRLSECIVVNAPPQLVWDYVTDPDNSLRFMSGITRWQVEGDKRTGLGARYRMLMRVGSAEMGGLVEVVEFHEPRDMAWSSITGVDQRGRWRLRRAPGGRTKIEFRFAYGVAGSGLIGYVAEHVAAPLVRNHLRRSLQQLRREVQHEYLRQQAADRQAERQPA